MTGSRKATGSEKSTGSGSTSEAARALVGLANQPTALPVNVAPPGIVAPLANVARPVNVAPPTTGFTPINASNRVYLAAGAFPAGAKQPGDPDAAVGARGTGRSQPWRDYTATERARQRSARLRDPDPTEPEATVRAPRSDRTGNRTGSSADGEGSSAEADDSLEEGVEAHLVGFGQKRPTASKDTNAPPESEMTTGPTNNDDFSDEMDWAPTETTRSRRQRVNPKVRWTWNERCTRENLDQLYRSYRTLGKGGFGEVWAYVRDEPERDENDLVAVKFNRNRLRAAKEARVCKSVNARVNDKRVESILKFLGDAEDFPHPDSRRGQSYAMILVNEYCSLGNVKEMFKRTFADRQPLAEFEIFTFIHDVSSALAWIHQGSRQNPRESVQAWRPMIHCDIKPENIFIKPRRDRARPRCFVVADFGLTTHMKDGCDFVESGGTFQWLPADAYEICKDDAGDYIRATLNTQPADVWGLGACVQFLARGEKPWRTNHLDSAEMHFEWTVSRLGQKDGEAVLPLNRNVVNNGQPLEQRHEEWFFKNARFMMEYSDFLETLNSQILHVDPAQRPTARVVRDHAWLWIQATTEEWERQMGGDGDKWSISGGPNLNTGRKAWWLRVLPGKRRPWIVRDPHGREMFSYEGVQLANYLCEAFFRLIHDRPIDFNVARAELNITEENGVPEKDPANEQLLQAEIDQHVLMLDALIETGQDDESNDNWNQIMDRLGRIYPVYDWIEITHDLDGNPR